LGIDGDSVSSSSMGLSQPPIFAQMITLDIFPRFLFAAYKFAVIFHDEP